MEIKENKIKTLEKLSKSTQILNKEELDASLGSLEKKDCRNVAFTGKDEDKRDKAASLLHDKLSMCRIYVSGKTHSDSLFGGLDKYSGQLIRDKVNESRNNNRITDSDYNKLIDLLKDACYYQ